MFIKPLNDQPSLDDGLKIHTKLVEDIVANIRQSDAPKTIAITGYWGSGKTGILARVYKELLGENAPIVTTDTKQVKKIKNIHCLKECGLKHGVIKMKISQLLL